MTLVGVARVKDHTDEETEKVFSSGTAVAMSEAIMRMLIDSGLSFAAEGFATIDSCSTNVGETGGVVALLNAAICMDLRLHLVHCYSHILHNTLGTGMTEGWGADPTRKREGTNTRVAFFLEGLSSFIRKNWDALQLGAYGILRCPELCITRWNIYSSVAEWFLRHYQQVQSASKQYAKQHGNLPPPHLKVIEDMMEPEMLLQCVTLAEWSRVWMQQEFAWAEGPEKGKMLKMHDRVTAARAFFEQAEADLTQPFQAVFDWGSKFGWSQADVESKVVRPFFTKCITYYFKRVAFLFKGPFLLAGERTHTGRACRSMLPRQPQRRVHAYRIAHACQHWSAACGSSACSSPSAHKCMAALTACP